MKGSVDRIEDNNIAVIILDNGDIINKENNINLKEGDIVNVEDNIITKEDNMDRKRKMIELQKKVFKRR